MGSEKLFRKFLMMNIGFYSVQVPITLYFSVMLKSYGYSETFVGTLVSMGAASGIAIKLILGRLADKYGSNKQIILFSASLCSVCAAGLVFFYGSYAYLVFYSLIIIGLCGSLHGIHESWMLRTAEAFQARLNYGTMRGVGSMSFAFMSLLLGWAIARWGYIASVYVALIFGALTVINAALIPALPPPPASAAKKPGLLDDIKYFARNHEYLLIVAAMFFAQITYGVADIYTPMIYLDLGGTSDIVGLGSFICAFSESFIMIASPKIAKKFGHKKLMVFGLAFFTVKYFAFSVAQTPIQLAFMTLFQTVSYGIVTPVSIALISKAIDEEHQATGLQLLYIILSLPRVLFGTIGGSIYQNFGYKAMLYATCPWALVGAFLMLHYYFLRKKARINSVTNA